MDSSKRDIYDLIAELAKSANIDIHGTEFEAKVSERNPIPSMPENGSKNTPKQDVVDSAKLLMLEKLQQATSIEELQHLSFWKESEASMRKESSSFSAEKDRQAEANDIQAEANKSVKYPQRIALLPKSKHAASKDHADSFEELFEKQSEVESNRVNSNDVSANKKASETEFQSKQMGDWHSMYYTLQSMLQKEIQSGNADILKQLETIESSLQDISTKDQLTQMSLELKVADDKIFTQVVNTREFIMQDFARMEEAKSIVSQNYLKWLGFLNLLLLILIGFYLLFQKFSELSKAAESKQGYQMEQPIQNGQPIPSQIQQQISSQESLSQIEDEMILKPKSNSQVIADEKQLTIRQPKRIEPSKMEIAANNTSSFKSVNTLSAKKVSAREEIVQVSKQDLPQENTTNAEVYFGED